MASPTLLPDPTRLRLTCFEMNEQMITAVVTTTAVEGLCPLCQCRSTRIHSRYTRLVADLPWMGCALRLELHTRRFFCLNAHCPRQIFTERLPNVVAPYARRTGRKLANASCWVWVSQSVLIPYSDSFTYSKIIRSRHHEFWALMISHFASGERTEPS